MHGKFQRGCIELSDQKERNKTKIKLYEGALVYLD